MQSLPPPPGPPAKAAWKRRPFWIGLFAILTVVGWLGMADTENEQVPGATSQAAVGCIDSTAAQQDLQRGMAAMEKAETAMLAMRPAFAAIHLRDAAEAIRAAAMDTAADPLIVGFLSQAGAELDTAADLAADLLLVQSEPHLDKFSALVQSAADATRSTSIPAC